MSEIKEPIITYPEFKVPSRLNQANPNFTRPDVVREPLYCICATFNPERARKFMKNAEDSYEYLIQRGFILISIEGAFGERDYIHVDKKSERHLQIQVRTTSQLWLKENLQNVACAYLPEGAKYVCFIDPDVRFFRDDIVGETLQQLQHFQVVQMFRAAFDTDRHSQAYALSYGFVYDMEVGTPMGQPQDDGSYYFESKKDGFNHFHTGYAWAYRVETLNQLGGLFDIGILGSGDNHMSKALYGMWEKSVNMGVTQHYKDKLKSWQHNALTYVKKNVGYVRGDLLHMWHGAKVNRGYKTRWNILVRNSFNPNVDIKKDVNGIYQLVTENERQWKLRDEIRQYFRARDDDSTTMDNGSMKF